MKAWTQKKTKNQKVKSEGVFLFRTILTTIFSETSKIYIYVYKLISYWLTHNLLYCQLAMRILSVSVRFYTKNTFSSLV
jgi:hypothetical protein